MHEQRVREIARAKMKKSIKTEAAKNKLKRSSTSKKVGGQQNPAQLRSTGQHQSSLSLSKHDSSIHGRKKVIKPGATAGKIMGSANKSRDKFGVTTGQVLNHMRKTSY